MFKRIIILLVVWVAWIVYSKEFLLSYFVPQYGDLYGYIISSLIAFFGGWFTWNLLIRRKLL
jgi:hypothetical protein